jgi:hypothetical protein
VSALTVALVSIAAFLLGLRTGIALGYRAERRRKSDARQTRA